MRDVTDEVKAMLEGKPVKEVGPGHNSPPEPTIQEIVRYAQQTKDIIEILKGQISGIEKPFREQMERATYADRMESDRLKELLSVSVAKIKAWQEKQRLANPFADPREASRVIIDGEVVATVRINEGFEIVKADLVPRELCKPDDVKIKARLALSEEEEIPGINRLTKYGTILR